MSGPIVRTGTTPEYWKNWDQIFGDKTAGKKAAKGAAKKAAAKNRKESRQERTKEGGKEEEVTSLGSTSFDTTTQADSNRMRLCSFFVVAALFFTAALLNSSIPGVGEPHYLSKAKAFAQPDWCSRDFFLTSSNAHYVFYVLVGPLTRIVSLESVALIGRGLQFLMLACGWTMLGRTIGLDCRRQIMSAAIFTVLTMLGNFSGEWILGGFESKVPAWSLCLMTMHFWIRSQLQPRHQSFDVIKAGVCCGLACALHPVVGIWMSICIGMAALADIIRGRIVSDGSLTSLRQLAVFSCVAIIFALPGLLPHCGCFPMRHCPNHKGNWRTSIRCSGDSSTISIRWSSPSSNGFTHAFQAS